LVQIKPEDKIETSQTKDECSEEAKISQSPPDPSSQDATSDPISTTTSAEVDVSNAKPKKSKPKKRGKRFILKEEYIDIIKDAFWNERPWILG
jgi:hypothetical protein